MFFADYISLIYMRVPANMGLLFSMWSDPLVHPTVLEVELQVKTFWGKLLRSQEATLQLLQPVFPKYTLS